MRIVTRPDFDGIVCATLLNEVFEITEPVLWTEPVRINNRLVGIKDGDIIANLPYHPNGSWWFDHHFTNSTGSSFRGEFRIAPSAAGIIHDYFRGRFKRNYDRLVRETDRIDSAHLTREEVLLPNTNPYVNLSFTIKGGVREDEDYWNKVCRLLGSMEIEDVMTDPDVSRRVRTGNQNDREYSEWLLRHTRIDHGVSITDFRRSGPVTAGNRFLVFSLFPETHVNLRIKDSDDEQGVVIVSISHSIFNRKCRVHCGKLAARFGGGGHLGAGSCSCPESVFEASEDEVISILKKNMEI